MRGRRRPGLSGLEEDDVGAVRVVRAAEEMIEADLENLGDRGVGGEMISEFATGRVHAHDHRQRVPANDRADLDVAGIGALLFERNGVLIGAKGQHVRDNGEILLRCLWLGRAIGRRPVRPLRPGRVARVPSSSFAGSTAPKTGIHLNTAFDALRFLARRRSARLSSTKFRL